MLIDLEARANLEGEVELRMMRQRKRSRYEDVEVREEEHIVKNR